jgi:hypothetical protein
MLALLSHYWRPEDDPAVFKLQAADWVDDLSEYDADVVAGACKMWRRANSKRPTPHELRALCRAELEYRRPIEVPDPDEPRDVYGPDFDWEWRCRYWFGSCQGRWDGQYRFAAGPEKKEIIRRKMNSICYKRCEMNLNAECRAQLSWNRR